MILPALLPFTGPVGDVFDANVVRGNDNAAAAVLNAALYGVYNIRATRYGASGDLTHDDSTAIQRAMMDIDSAGGGVLYAPPTVSGYLVSGPLYYPSNLVILGHGLLSRFQLATGLGVAGARTMFLPMRAGVVNARVQSVAIDQRGDAYSEDRNAPCFDMSGTTDTAFDDVDWFNLQTMGPYCNSPIATPTVRPRLTRQRFWGGYAGAASLFGVVLGMMVDDLYAEHHKDDVLALQDSQIATVWGQPDGFSFTNIRGKNNTRTNTFGSTPHLVNIYGATNGVVGAVESDGTMVSTVLVEKGAHFRATDIALAGPISIVNAGVSPDASVANPGSGIEINDADRISVANYVIRKSRKAGLAAARCTALTIGIGVSSFNGNEGLNVVDCVNWGVADGAQFLDNGASGTNPWGVGVESTSPSSYSDAGEIGRIHAHDTGANTQTHGAHFTGADTKVVRMVGANLSNNMTAPIGGTITATMEFEENRPYNPVGIAAVTIGVSPATITNGASPSTLYVPSGTITTLKKGGVTLFTATPAVVELRPNESVVLAYPGVVPTAYLDTH